jgi:hypothetical protein
MGKVLKIGVGVLSVAAVVAINFTPLGPAFNAFIVNAGLGAGISVGTSMAILDVLTLSIYIGSALTLSTLFAPKNPNLASQEASSRLNVSLDPDRAGNMIFGNTAMATALTYAETEETKKEYVTEIFAAASHQIYAFGATYINDELAFNAAGTAQGDWSGAATRLSALGTESQAALAFSNDTYPSTAHFYGVATYGVQFKLSNDKFSSGIPNRITQEGQGALVYDPRLDTTRGGSGAHRADDQTTWEYTSGGSLIGENPVLQAVWYMLGWKKNSILAIGMGLNPDNIDWASVIAAANVSEEIVDSKWRYKTHGIEVTDGDHNRVLNTFTASCGLKVLKSPAGVYSVWIPNDDLISTNTISKADIIGEVKYTPTDLKGLYNVGRGQFPDPSALYQLRPCPEVRETTYVTEDGRDRVFEVNLPFIQDSDVAQRVLRYHVRRSRYRDTWIFAVNFSFLSVNVLDIITLNCDETANVDQLCRVMQIDISPQGIIVLTLIEEHTSIYDDTTVPVTMPTALSAPGYNPAAVFAVTNLAVTATSISGSGSAARDVLKVTWDDPGGAVKRTDIQYKKTGDTDWLVPGVARINDTQYLILDVLPNTGYDVRARHVSWSNVDGAWYSTTQTTGTNTVVDFDVIGGTAKPDDNATVGATWNENISDIPIELNNQEKQNEQLLWTMINTDVDTRNLNKLMGYAREEITLKVTDDWVKSETARTVLQANIDTTTASIITEESARVSEDAALALSITNLTTTVGTNTTDVSTNVSSINGIQGKYAVKIDVNGAVSGFGLISEANEDGTPFSEFIINADRFAIIDPADPDTSVQHVPFVVSGGDVYMSSAFIEDASITNAKIIDLNATKITAGTITADKIVANTITLTSNVLDTVDPPVDTGNVVDNAITELASSFTAGSIVINSGTSTNVEVASATIDVTNVNNVFLNFTGTFSTSSGGSGVYLRFYRGGTAIGSSLWLDKTSIGTTFNNFPANFGYTDTSPGTGSVTYTVQALEVTNLSGSNIQLRSLLVLGIKK